MAKKKETKAIVYDPCDSCEVKKLNALLQSFIMNKADLFGIQFNDKMFYFDKMVKFTHDSEIEKLEQQIKELLERLADKEQEGFDEGYKKALDECEQQLAEKDKEIEELKEMCDFLKENKICTVNFKDRTETYLFPKSEENIIRHQVCEEIREFVKENWDYDDFKNFLDQIEKGE